MRKHPFIWIGGLVLCLVLVAIGMAMAPQAAAAGVVAIAGKALAGVAGTAKLMMAVPPIAGRIVELKQKRSKLIEENDTALQADAITDEDKAKVEGRFKEIDGLTEQITMLSRQEQQAGLLEQRGTVTTAAATQSVETPATPVVNASAGDDRGREARMAVHTLALIRGIAIRSYDTIRDAQRELARDGHYGRQGEQRAAGDYYSTLVDADGAILLPTTVLSEIDKIARVAGVARGLTSLYTGIIGKLKVPGASGTLPVGAIGEGGEISSSKRSFTAVELNPKKWGVIVPWTFEAGEEFGPQLLNDVNSQIGESFAVAEDNAMFNGDGTATYNSIKGILAAARAGVGSYVLPATKVQFSDITADDLFKCRTKLPAGIRNEGVYVFHPDMDPYLRLLKDGNGTYLFAWNDDQQIGRLGGRPVRYSEALAAMSTSGANKVFGVYGAFRYWKMGVGAGLSSELLTEATVKDADTGTAINLATQDMKALRFKEQFDMDTTFESAFTKISTPAA